MTEASRRLLICGPVFPAHAVGGLRDVLIDLADGLSARGWQVECRLAASTADAEPPLTAGASTGWRGWAEKLAQRLAVPSAVRVAARFAGASATTLERQSAQLTAVEQALATKSFDAVLVCVDGAPLGVVSLVCASHPAAVVVSLGALARELAASALLPAARRVSRLRLGRQHPRLGKACDASRIQTAVFASESWREDAVRQGLRRESAHVIHFGVSSPSVLPIAETVRSPARLLWAARASEEKGLHLYIPAVARLAQTRQVQLTIVAGHGTDAYLATVRALIESHGLRDVVTFAAPVSRDALPDLFAAHDVLLFHSSYREPVAQMLFHAFAHGLIVIGPAPRVSRAWLRPDTGFCFDTPTPSAMADAIARALDSPTREAVRARAFDVVRESHDLAITIERYDRLLTTAAAAAGSSESGPRARRPTISVGGPSPEAAPAGSARRP